MHDQNLIDGVEPNFSSLWPGYLLRYGGFALSLFMIGTGYFLGKQVYIALGFVILVGTLFLYWAARWTTKRRYDADQLLVTEALFSMSQAQPGDNLASVDLGLRIPAVALSRHLTTGRITVIDVFNPQLTGGKELARARKQAPSYKMDPRLDWFDGRINLLPLPDNSVSAVFMPLILSEFSQHGDRQTLLREIKRILRPNGRLLVAEQNTSWLNWLSLDPGSSRLLPTEYWRRLLLDAGFDVRRQEEFHGLTICMRADKPSPFAGRQLSLDLRFHPGH